MIAFHTFNLMVVEFINPTIYLNVPKVKQTDIVLSITR